MAPRRYVRIPVRSAENVSPWCAEKLGLERVETISDYNEEGSIVNKFNADGHSFTLTSQDPLEIQNTPMLVTRKIEKMKDILGSRRIETRTIARDR